ncbi:MAG TPA: site-2 protease family protein [Candidatus Paceibacterota bacterium]|nr:site-2 protease family protein [Candidatus Paceibacterota bacterium]
MPSDPLFIVFQLAILILSIVIHEVAHGYAANALGDPTAKLSGRLTLNPLRHIDPMGSIVVPALLVLTNAGILFGWAKPVPYNPYNLRNKRWGEAIVAFAGPGTNLLIAILFGLVARFGAGQLPDPFVNIALVASFVNLFLGLFNLIPLPPLDGYTTLRGLLPYQAGMALREFESRVRGGGIASLILILVVFSVFFAGPFSLLVSYLFTLLVGS